MSKRLKIGSVASKPAVSVPQEEPPAEVDGKEKHYVRASVYLPPAVHKQLRKLAFETERSQHQLMRDWIAAGLQRETGKSWDELVASEA